VTSAAADVFILRHGTTALNEEGRLVSSTDAPLSEAGRLAAAETGRALRDVPFHSVLTSPARRALETVEAVLSARREPIEFSVEPLLAEVSFGRFEGLTRAEIEESGVATEFRAWEAGSAGGDAEGLAEASERARAAMNVVEAAPRPVLAVTHGVFARVLVVTSVLGLPAHAYRRLQLDNAGWAELSWGSGFPRLVRLNSLLRRRSDDDLVR
jgi:broad specificity phosphatase PhoE